MVSRQETARPLLTPGEVMQLPPGDELVLVSGIPPIRAWKARYYEDRCLASRILPPPVLPNAGNSGSRHVIQANDWTPLSDPDPDTATSDESAAGSLADHDRTNGGIRREPTLPNHEAIVHERPEPNEGIGGFVDEPDGETICAREMDQKLHVAARRAALDRGDGLGM
jgi:type IV secretion system protein VirD4